MTANDIYIRVYQETGILARAQVRPSLAATSDQSTLLANYLADAGKRLAHINRFEATSEDTIAEDAYTWTLPLNLGRVHHVMLDGVELDQEEGSAVMELATENVADGNSGTPTMFGIWDGVMYLNTPVSEEMTLRVYYLTTDAIPSIAVIPVEFEEALVAYVMYRWLEGIGAGNLAYPHRERWGEMLAILNHRPRKKRRATRKLRAY